jgi:amino acid transporter
MGPEVNDNVSFQWSRDLWDSNWWSLGSKPRTWLVELHPSEFIIIIIITTTTTTTTIVAVVITITITITINYYYITTTTTAVAIIIIIIIIINKFKKNIITIEKKTINLIWKVTLKIIVVVVVVVRGEQKNRKTD